MTEVLEKTVPLEPPASRVPAVVSRAQAVERELTALKLQAAERALACAEGKPGARSLLAELRDKIAVAEFELARNGAAQDLAMQLDQTALDAWRADIQTLSPEEIIAGISRDECCRRCRPGDCVIAGADAVPSECIHPVMAGPLHFLRHKANPKILAVYAAARAKVGAR